jgi:anti-anti-sigma factor
MTNIFAANKTTMSPRNLPELVRGKEQGLLDQMGPVVLERTVTLDLAHVERIDAAGIAALITLYGSARLAGHDFAVTNASPRVAEILTLVGLDRILVAHDAVPCPQGEPCFEQSAA